MNTLGDRDLLLARWSVAPLLALFALAGVRATTPIVTMPGFDVDPMISSVPSIGLGPTAAFAIDLAAIATSGVLLALLAAAGHRPRWIETLVLTLASVSLLWHGSLAPSAALDHLLLGATWAAAGWCAVAVSVASRIEVCRRLALMVSVGIVACIAMRCAAQYFWEHPQTVREFESQKDRILASNGWLPGSPSARLFERRLLDPAPLGWFGLTNVVATFAAAALVLACGLLAGAWRRVDRAGQFASLVAATIAGALLIACGSKGAFAAAGLGVALVGLTAFRPMSSRLGVAVLLALPVGVLLAIALRAMLGETLSERSLLFRAQYLEAAARIITAHPFVGVGPAGFKDAYLLAKNPLSPEEVLSPHNLFADFTAALGLGGVALSMFWWRLAASAGVQHSAVIERPPAVPDAVCLRLGALTLAVVVVVGAAIEREIATPESALIRIGGLLLSAGGAWWIFRTPEPDLRLARVGVSAAILSHCMVEVTPVQSQAAMLVGIWLACQSGTEPLRSARSSSAGATTVRAVPGLLALALAAAGCMLLRDLERWEDSLRAGAARLAGPVLAWQSLESLPSEPALRDRILRDIRSEVQLQGIETAGGVDPLRTGVLTWKRRAAEESFEDLLSAIARQPTHPDTRQAASRLALSIASLEPALGADPTPWLERAESIAADATRLHLKQAPAWAWLSVVRRRVSEMHPGADRRTWLLAALEARERASQLDPFSPVHAENAARLAMLAELPDRAAAFARRALELDEGYRLDPLRQFDPSTRAWLEKVAGR